MKQAHPIFLTFLTILTVLFCATSLHSQELTFYVIPPKGPINWNSPRSLLLSYAGSMLAGNKHHTYSHPMGHVFIELQDSSHHATAGMEARSKSDMAGMVSKKGYGLGILFADIPGRLVEGEENETDISERSREGDIAFIKFRLTPEAFAKLWQYLQDYKSNGYDQVYNGENKPREGKGAGCSAFGASFIELAGLLSADVLSEWKIQVNIPQKLIGGPNNNGGRVGILKIIANRKWAASAGQQCRTASFYEPSMIYNWIGQQWNWHGNGAGPTYATVVRGNAKGIVIDCTQRQLPNTPTWFPDQAPPAVALLQQAN